MDLTANSGTNPVSARAGLSERVGVLRRQFLPSMANHFSGYYPTPRVVHIDPSGKETLADAKAEKRWQIYRACEAVRGCARVQAVQVVRR